MKGLEAKRLLGPGVWKSVWEDGTKRMVVMTATSGLAASMYDPRWAFLHNLVHASLFYAGN